MYVDHSFQVILYATATTAIYIFKVRPISLTHTAPSPAEVIKHYTVSDDLHKA